jgi:putative SOS response-associated peptidase YedK
MIPIMCGRYTLLDDGSMVRQHYRADNPDYSFEPNYNAAPTQKMPVVTRKGDKNHAENMKWGIHRQIGPDKEKDIINTRNDKALSRFWAKTVRNYRCLIPATGFYEWKVKDGSKAPYFIRPKHMNIYSFAGIYSEDKDGNHAYSIMTTGPNKEMSSIHNRMPVILQDDDHEEAWLTADEDDVITDLMRPFTDGGLEMWEISKAVNSPRNNSPDLLERF